MLYIISKNVIKELVCKVWWRRKEPKSLCSSVILGNFNSMLNVMFSSLFFQVSDASSEKFFSTAAVKGMHFCSYDVLSPLQFLQISPR